MPAVSRQRDKIAFICDITGNPDLFIQDFSPDTGATDKPRQIFATYKATQGTPAFSPDGKQIAFVSNKDGSPRIYVMDIPPPGKSLKDIQAKLLSKYSKESTAPSWSPDGTKIAYCAMTNGTRQIWMFDLTKNEERQLTQGAGNKENPSWAPNSVHLVFNTNDIDKESSLYMMNINQPGVVKISSGRGDKRFPNWEPS
jgi:TolB protein